MKVERKHSDFSAEKRKRNENMETKTEICGTETNFFFAEVETEMEQCFPAEQMRKQKFPFPTNTEFMFNSCFTWPI
jgi:uncharacterized membrane protein